MDTFSNKKEQNIDTWSKWMNEWKDSEKERISTVLFHVYTILENETSEMAEGRSVIA